MHQPTLELESVDASTDSSRYDQPTRVGMINRPESVDASTDCKLRVG